MNIKRVLTTVVGLPIVICVLLFSNKYIMDIVFTIVGLIAMNEYIKCVSKKVKVIKWISYLSVLLIAFLHIIPSEIGLSLIPFIIPILLLILFFHVIVSNMKITFEDIVYTFTGILYIVGFIIFLPMLYGNEGIVKGKYLIWFVISAAWGTDIFAYLIGKRFGKTKFSTVSPNKSVEGCIAGIIGAVIISILIAVIFNMYFNLSLSYVLIGVISFVLSIVGQIGDFAASVIKRSFDVKDFSNLFPGHGGMLDRIDSVMFIAPFAYLLLIMFV